MAASSVPSDLAQWASALSPTSGAGDCDQEVCFGRLTHGFASGETPPLPPIFRRRAGKEPEPVKIVPPQEVTPVP